MHGPAREAPARALLLVADGFDARDVIDVQARLQRDGYTVSLCGLKSGATVTGADGATVVPDKDYLSVNIGAYDLVVVPGGAAGTALAGHKSMVNIVYSAAHKGRTIGAIGTGIQTLIAADANKSPYDIDTGVKVLAGPIFRGREVATVEGQEEAFEKAGARLLKAPVVVDGPIVTARDTAGPQLGRFVEALVPTARRFAAQVH